MSFAGAPRGQRGVALIALLAVVVLATSWLIVSRVNASSAQLLAAKRARNAAVLNRAKQALIGYVAAQAAKGLPNLSPEQNPGAMPCPEAPGNFGDAAQEGIYASSCSLPKLGRFPWRTLGMDKIVDADGEPLWYAVSPGWAYTSRTNFPVINSNTQGQLTVDGVPNAAVALIIAPGAAVKAPAATGCTAWEQTRPTSGTLDWRNYLECENATSPADSVFVTKGPTGSEFNDQVMLVTVADVMPGIEAAVAKRMEIEIVPQLKGMYASSSWGTNVSATHPVYPFAATFGNPTTATYRGAALTQGLLPMTYQTDYSWNGSAYVSSSCNSATNPRCTPSSFVDWGTPTVTKASGSGTMTAPACTTDPTFSWCWSPYTGSVTLKYEDVIQNVGNVMRQRVASPITYAEAWAFNNATGAWTNLAAGTPSVTYTLKSDASFGTSFQNSFPSYASGGWYYIYVDRKSPALVFDDHPLLDARYTTDTSWFVRNGWHQLVYYAVAPGYSPSVLPSQPGCTTGSTCLSVASLDPANPVSPSGAQRVLLMLAGRSINGSARPSANRSDYFEFGNSLGTYQRRKVSPLAVTGALTDSGAANAYVIGAGTVAVGSPLHFKAANSNTGAATLTTAATGTLSIVNADGTSLTSGQITANGVVQVIYDGARFVLLQRPFNDRLVIVDSN